MIKDDKYFMRLALKEAKKALAKGEIPIGAVLVSNETKEVLSRGYNKKESTHDVSSHAEIEVIRKASKRLNNWRLNGTTLYVTIEPCTMCASAILQAKIDRVVFGASEKEMGGFGGKLDLTKSFATDIVVEHGVLEEKCLTLLKENFKNKR